MTQEEKELLLKDLCARLTYHTHAKVWLKDGTTEEGALDLEHNYGDVLRGAFYYDEIVKIKPYLFPLSSRTDEQKKESPFESALLNAFINGYISQFEDGELNIDDLNRLYDWLNKNHFDYRGLIEKGLAIDATGLNIYEFSKGGKQ